MSHLDKDKMSNLTRADIAAQARAMETLARTMAVFCVKRWSAQFGVAFEADAGEAPVIIHLRDGETIERFSDWTEAAATGWKPD